MKFLKFLFIGIFFGIVMTKSEVISWYRIQEMFRFQAFHMYGVIGSALAVGIVMTQWLKSKNVQSVDGESLQIYDKNKGVTRYLFGGIIFGLGWALSGACPGPMYTLIGNGYGTVIILILSAVVGTFVYGMVRERLPH